MPGSPAGQAAFGSLGRDKARAVARTIAQVNMFLNAHGIALSPDIHKKPGDLILGLESSLINQSPYDLDDRCHQLEVNQIISMTPPI